MAQNDLKLLQINNGSGKDSINLGASTNYFKNVYTNAISNDYGNIDFNIDYNHAFHFFEHGEDLASISNTGLCARCVYPFYNDTSGCTLGLSNLRWDNVYSATFTGDTFTGNAASATKIYITDTTPTATTKYRLIYASGGESSNKDLCYNDDLVYTDNGTKSALRIGCNSHVGRLILSSGSNYAAALETAALTADRVITISDHAGTMITSGNYTEWASPRNHTHNVTISHTPAGTISKPTFTGTVDQETSSMAGTTSVPKGDHTHSYNRVSSVSAHTFGTGTYTSGGNSGSGVAFYAYSGSSKPSLTASITSKCLTVTFTSPATSVYTAAPNSHTHTYNRVNTIDNHTVSTTSYTTEATPSGSRVDVASNGHKHTYTAAGTISTPTFTGTTYTTTETTTTQNV